MAKRKKPVPKTPAPTKPAPTMTRTDELRQIEEGFRAFNRVMKSYRASDPKGALATVGLLNQEGYNPSEASISATSILARLDPVIAEGKRTRRVKSRGGESRAVTATAKTKKRVKQEWDALSQVPARNRASLIAKKLNLSTTHVRRVIKKANLC